MPPEGRLAAPEKYVKKYERNDDRMMEDQT
jgi:hypothetical protein